MPKLARKRATKPELHEPSTTFPWRIGDIVEMKTREAGYRGAWFRVEIKRVRRGKNDKLYATVVYKDYPDESEEEIVAIDFDHVTGKRILMIRPLPPPELKESTYDETEELNTMHVVVRDHWEIGDLVDWWYHDCWWLAEVISVLGDDRFQLSCPSPPNGEGGVYLAKDCDMRPSLNWSLKEQWTAPPSKEPRVKQCARLIGPALCPDVVPVSFLESEDIEKHVKLSTNEDKTQMSGNTYFRCDRKKEKGLNERSFLPKAKYKLQLKGEKQSQAKLLKSVKNLENPSEDDEQKSFNEEVYPIVSSDQSLSDGDVLGRACFSEEETCDMRRALTTVQDKHTLSDQIMEERLQNAKYVDSPKHRLQLESDTQGECARLKPKPHRRRPRKSSNTRTATSIQPKDHELKIKKGAKIGNPNQVLVKHVSEEKVRTDEALEALTDAIPRNSAKTAKKAANKGDPGEGTGLLYEEFQQRNRRQKISSDSSKVREERVLPEMGVVFDVGVENVHRSFKDEKKKTPKEKVMEEVRCVRPKGIDRPRKIRENSRHFEEKGGDKKTGGKVSEQNDGIFEVENEVCENSERKKKRRLVLKVSQDVKSENLSASWEEAVGEGTTSVHATAIATDFSINELQNENQQVHSRDTEFQTCEKQSEKQQDDFGQSEQRQAENKRTKESTTEIQVTKGVLEAETIPGQDMKTARTKKKSTANGLQLLDKYGLQEPSSVPCMPGITSDREDVPLEEDGFDRNDRLMDFPDRHSGRSARMSASPVRDFVPEFDLEGSDKLVSSNDVSICGSPGCLSEGVYLSSGALRENDLNDSAAGLETDADSCSVKFQCARAGPSEDCVTDPPQSRGSAIKPGTTHRVEDYSSLRKLVGKPAIKYKSVLSRKLVSTARREIWSKGKPLRKRKML